MLRLEDGWFKQMNQKISEDDWKVVEARLETMPEELHFCYLE